MYKYGNKVRYFTYRTINGKKLTVKINGKKVPY